MQVTTMMAILSGGTLDCYLALSVYGRPSSHSLVSLLSPDLYRQRLLSQVIDELKVNTSKLPR